MTDSEITLQPGDTLTVRVPAAEPVPEPEPPGDSPSGIPIPPVKSGWRRVAQTNFDGETIPFGGAFVSDKAGVVMGRNAGDDTSNRGFYSNRHLSIHDGVLDARVGMFNGRREMGCPMNKAPNPTNNGSTAPKSLRVVWTQKVLEPIDDFKFANMLSKYGVVRPLELDWPENRLQSRDVIPQAFFHIGGKDFHARAGQAGDLFEWHTYATELVAGQYAAAEFDGGEILRVTKAQVERLGGTFPIAGVHFIWQNETEIGEDLGPTSGEGHILYDWVAIEVPA